MSGGLDSTSLALHLLSEGYEVKAYAFNYGQKHSVELKKVQKNVKYLQKYNLPITLQIIDLRDCFNESASVLNKANNMDVPEGDYRDENMKSTVVENRNVIFSSIIYGKALAWANRTEDKVLISLGLHSGDHCFTGDTTILTPEGLKTVDTLNVGDKVFSLNPETQKICVDKCLDVIHKGFNNEIYTITTEDSDSIRLTSEHEVYVYGKDSKITKIKVKDLKIDDLLVSLCDPYNLVDSTMGTGLVPITNISVDTSKSEPVYDISVEKNHNFFAGQLGNVLISNSIYPDCRPESQEMAKELFRISNWGSEKVDYIAPFINIDKGEVLKHGVQACKALGINWKTIYKNTISCYTPNDKGESCGKCGTCTERLEAFEKCGLKDPIKYQN